MIIMVKTVLAKGKITTSCFNCPYQQLTYDDGLFLPKINRRYCKQYKKEIKSLTEYNIPEWCKLKEVKNKGFSG